MAKLAGRAFVERTFTTGDRVGDSCHLSVNVVKEQHQQQLADLSGRQQDLYMCLGDSHAAAGRLQSAYGAYVKAYGVGSSPTPDRLCNLVASLVEIVKIDTGDTVKTGSNQKDEEDMFTCSLCQSLWSEPVTLRCGHTFCRTCLEKDRPKRCRRCMADVNSTVASLKTNVLLSRTVEKWFPGQLAAVRLKQEGNSLFGQKKLQRAIGAYTKAIQHGESFRPSPVLAYYIYNINRPYLHNHGHTVAVLSLNSSACQHK